MLLPHLFTLSISILQYLFLFLGVLKFEVLTSLHPPLFGFFRKGLFFFSQSSFNLFLSLSFGCKPKFQKLEST